MTADEMTAAWSRGVAQQYRRFAFWIRAFGIEDMAREYELEAARYQSAAETLEKESKE